MRKLSLVAVGLSALIGLVAVPGLGSAPVNAAVPSGKSDGVATVRHRLHLRDDLRVTLRKLEARDMRTGKVRPLTDPPLGGCDYYSNAVLHGEITATYVNHVLTTTETDYFAGIQCFTTAPGQSMGALVVQGSLWIGVKVVDKSQEKACANPPNICNLVSTVGDHICAGQANCAGNYWVGSIADMILPEGWVWTTVPSGCNKMTDSFLRCSAVTDTVTIPPTH
jgi:hypothetical protein